MSKHLKIFNLKFKPIFTPSVFGLILVLFFQNCQEPTKGCLDIRATNFDVTANNACPDNCCVYPNLKLQISHFADTNIFNVGNKYKIGADSIQILQCQFYLSDFQLVTIDNKFATTTDSLNLIRQGDTKTVLNSFAVVSKNKGFSYNIGRFSSVGTYSEVRFKLGLSDEANKAIPAKMPTNTPLSIQADSMYLPSQNGYIFNKIVIAKGVNFKDTVQYFVTTARDLRLKTPKNLVFTEGVDAIIPIRINYLAFFKNVNFADSRNSVIQKLVVNTDNVFSIQ